MTFYSERNSVEIRRNANDLFKDPEVQLSTEQEQEVYEFAKSFYDGNFGALTRESSKNLEELVSMSPGAFIQEFYLGYFLTPKGREDVIKLGCSGVTEDEIAAGLGNIESIKSQVDDKERKRIAKSSLDWHKDQIVSALENDKELDEAHLDHNSARVNYNPAKLLEKAATLYSHRRFNRQAKTTLKEEEDSPVKAAKMLELELTITRTNAMLVDLFDDILALGKQLLGSSGSASSQEWLKQIEELTPVIFRALTRYRNEKMQTLDDFEYSLARRTDYIKQGVAWTKDGKISSISAETIEFANQVVKENEAQESNFQPVFGKVIIEKLNKTKWDADKFKEFCEAVVREWGILSEHQADWSEANERETQAEDYKWQIIIDPQKDSIKVSRTKKLLHIPETFNRSLVASLTVAAHELAHLAQAESDTLLAEKIPLAVAGGRRISASREGGAIDQEAKAYAMLGNKRPTRVGYLAALQAKLDGANLAQVAREFYDAYEDESKLSEGERHENRKIAADRALRLYRNGGYNSQPLDYLEGELTKRVISEVSPSLVEPIMIAGASFSLHDSMRLHQAGLYNAPTSTIFRPAEDVIRIFSSQFLEQEA